MARRESHIENVAAEPNVLTLSDSVIRRASVANPEFAKINEDAAGAAFLERNQTFLQAIKLYPKAVAWSVLLSTAIVIEGYDTVLLANLYGLSQFQQRYGYLQPDGSSVIPASWRSGLNNGANVGEILGFFITGIVQDAIGYRKTTMGALFLVVCFIFIVFFATNLPMLLCRRDPLRHSLGRLPDTYHGLRLGSVSCPATRLPYDVRQPIMTKRFPSLQSISSL